MRKILSGYAEQAPLAISWRKGQHLTHDVPPAENLSQPLLLLRMLY